MVRWIVAYLAAVLVTYVAAATAHTQSVMSNLAEMGAPVTLGDRLAASGHDLLGLAPMFLPMVAVALGIAFPVAGWIIHRLPWWRALGYSLAGGVAVLMIHVLLYQAFGITGIAGARGTLGLTVQALCGALGGLVFRQLLPRVPRHGAQQ